MTKPLSAAEIISKFDRKPRKVEVPEWGGHVSVAEISAADAERFFSKEKEYHMADFLAMCLVDDDGNRLFTDEQISDLGKKSAKVIRRLVEVAQEVNGYSEGKD